MFQTSAHTMSGAALHTQRKMLFAHLHTHELTDAHDRLVMLERREIETAAKFCSLELLATDAFGIIRIQTLDERVNAFFPFYILRFVHTNVEIHRLI